MKHLANCITASRIIGALALLLTTPLSPWFYGLFVFSGVTDMIDGPIARRTHTESHTGAVLDSIADTVLVAVSLIKLLPILHIPLRLWIWVGVIGAIKMVNLLSGLLCRRKLVMPHTVANKITGAALFALVLTIGCIDIRYTASAACAVATFAAVQEGHVIRTGRDVPAGQKERSHPL